VPIRVRFRRFWPGIVGAVIALAFVAFVLAAPNGGGGCMESYPMQCPVIEVVESGFAATAVGLIVCVLLLFFASASRCTKVRISGAVVGLAALFIVMVLGASASLLHTVDLRY
jgi:hypothetical protein